jgi:hypothetical protein
MKKPLSALVLALTIFLPLQALAFDPNNVLSDEEMRDSESMNLDQIQAFLERGYLAEYRTEDNEGRERSAAEIIWRTAQNVGINPKFLLVLLQKEQSLINDEDPTQKQLDWATGYAVCDDCSMSDPSLARWKGFGKQVNSAALQFIEGYMADIEAHGKTAGKYGTGIPVTIDGTRVTPATAATAALYAYTPHLHGNKNFATLWNTWFGRDYPNGTLLQASGEEGVYLMQNGYLRPITSASALASRFDKKLIVPVSKSVLERFALGKPISLPNYTLVKDEDGHIYLLVDDALRHIDSMEAFRGIGFSEDEIVDIKNDELQNFDEGEPITLKTVDPQGKLLQLKTNGAVFYVKDGERHAILDKSILLARFPNARLTPVEPVVVEQYRESSPVLLPDGYLVRSAENPAVFVIADGLKRPILSEAVFTSFGYEWSNVKIVPQEILDLHEEGDALQGASEDEVGLAAKK